MKRFLFLTLVLAGTAHAADPFRIAISHVATGADHPCAAFDSGDLCAHAVHWAWESGGKALADSKAVRARLKEEADGARAKQDDAVSERDVEIQGDPGAPYAVVQETILACAEAGIYRVSLGGPKEKMRKVWLEHGDRLTRTDGKETSTTWEEVRLYIKWVPGKLDVVRNFFGGPNLESDEDLVVGVRARIKQNQVGGWEQVPVLLDIAPDVPFRVVMELVDLCQANKVEPIDFAMPKGSKRKPGPK